MAKELKTLTQEELQALTNELNEVLVKHNAEMSVSSTISLMKVVDTEDTTNDSDNTSEEKSDSETA